MWIMHKDNVYKWVSSPTRRAELEQLGFVVEPEQPAPNPPSAPSTAPLSPPAPVMRDAAEENGDNPLKWNGKYITQLQNVKEMRECLRELGIDVRQNDTRAVLKAKLDRYCQSVKSRRA